MAIAIYKSKIKRYCNGETKQKYMVKMYVQQAVDFDTIAERISKGSSATVGDVYMVLQQLEKEIMYCLELGQPVKLGRLGSFFPRITVKSVDTKEEVNMKTIKKFSCAFKPSKYMKNFFKTVKYEFITREL
ncbi:MAG: HU family DNA-binding protein [Bacteroidales bacterium]